MNEELDSYRAINDFKTTASEARRARIVIWIMGSACAVAFGMVLATSAYAHEAMSVKGDPLGWAWPRECCNSAATSPTGDCAVIDAATVEEKPDGYHVTLGIGQHPKLKTRGYSTVIPYGLERSSPSGEYGICLSTDGARRYCFFSGAKGF